MSIKTNTVMNRGPGLRKKRDKHGETALTNHERNILKAYDELMRKPRRD